STAISFFSHAPPPTYTSTLSLHDALPISGHVTALIGTVETRVAGTVLDSARTTPEAPDLQALFAGAREKGVTAAVMEVSSHALRSEEHTSELQSPYDLVCRLLLEKKKTTQ